LRFLYQIVLTLSQSTGGQICVASRLARGV
jgi:hypothetical protein